ncbi:MAG: helix-turn-helix transcriptional regulator [Vibrio sp.]
MTNQPDELKFIRLATVCEVADISKTTIYRLMANGEFPKPVNLGASARRWIESEVLAWKEQKKQERDGVAA